MSMFFRSLVGVKAIAQGCGINRMVYIHIMYTNRMVYIQKNYRAKQNEDKISEKK